MSLKSDVSARRVAGGGTVGQFSTMHKPSNDGPNRVKRRMAAGRALFSVPGITGAFTLLAAAACLGGDPVGPDGGEPLGRVEAGEDFACTVDANEIGWCWGRNFRGQLGDGTRELRRVPTAVAGNLRFRSIGIHGLGEHACGVTTEDIAFCWGENDFGQLGDGSMRESHLPVRVSGDVRFRSVTAGWRFSCGISVDAIAYCWGRGVWGQLGDGRATQSSTPVAVETNLRFTGLKAGSNNLACGLTTDGDAYCWGLNFFGALGTTAPDTCGNQNFTLECATTPARIDAPGGQRFIAVSPGQSYACGIVEGGQAFCWGANNFGQLGATTSTCVAGSQNPCSSTPIAVGGDYRFSDISAGGDHTCAVRQDGAGMCWGNGMFSKLGDGFLHPQSDTPIQVISNVSFVAISAGADHTCATGTDENLYCWGANDVGQLGDGTDNIGLTPVAVAQPR
jgi:alpha-tubulin suppressor-like RCC1 family protein